MSKSQSPISVEDGSQPVPNREGVKMKQTTIQSKLIRSTMMVLGTAFVAVILVVIGISTLVSNANLNEAERKISAGLAAKGRILVSNNSQALQGMVADNAFMAVQALVGKTVADDNDVVYGIFMDVEKQPWVMADDSNTTGAVEGKRNLDDSMSVWAASIKAPEMKASRFKGKEVLEFAAPIIVNDEALGTIRYGISTEEMRTSIAEARRAARGGLVKVSALLILLGLAAAWASFVGLRRQAQRITKPIGDLALAASTIAGGDYGKPVEVKSDDEIGALSDNFESMRQTVKKYTEHLEELVQEKMQQVRDILENIDQGLFTVNFDGTINPEYSQQANTLLQVQDVAAIGIKDVFRLSESQMEDWRNWIALVQQKHATMRWEKLARLSPVQDLELGLAPEERRFIKISYQKVYDRQQSISRIMVLAQDQTEARRIEQIVAEEKLRHENEVKTILGLVNNVPEVIHDFMQDLDRRLHNLQSNVANLLEESERARADYPDGSPLYIDPETVMEVFRDLHTIKGNSATYGFETLSRQAHEAEEVLEALKPPVRQRSGVTIRALLQCLDQMDASYRDIQRTQRKLSGGQDEVVVHVPEHKLDYVRNLAEALSTDTKVLDREMMAPLLEACKQLRNINILKLVEKYRGLIHRLSDKLEKHVELEVQPNHIELEPHFFAPFDEALVHIIRNAVDHAIEPEDERIANRKDPHGRIRMILHSFDDMMVLTVADDGRGIDVSKLVDKAIANGILDAERAAVMDDREKLDLVFQPGLSTSDSVTDISGRGVGMSAVRESIQRMGGRVTIQSTPGKGTQISLHLPPQT